MNRTTSPAYIDCTCSNQGPHLHAVSGVANDGGSTPVIVPESLPKPSTQVLAKIEANRREDNVLVIAAANYGMRDYLYNWIESLERTQQDKQYLVFCLDDKLYQHMTAAGYQDHATQVPESCAITHAKTIIVQQLLYLNTTVLFSDVDIVWLRPGTVDYIMSLDPNQELDAIFQLEGAYDHEVNTGFYLMRPTYTMKRFLAQTIYLQDTSPDKVTQQVIVNRIIDSVADQIALLDVNFFPNGKIYFDTNIARARGVNPYILHANYRVGAQKKDELASRGLWYLDEKWLADIDTQIDAPAST
ncbi:hypothetical protein K492DRAFT_121262 [Lichtheimia hyalospora FSU 10163]|nr:hypothetical protein K492DRAFT_121262 [Lichtheimia hyalospora FSU 10163]